MCLRLLHLGFLDELAVLVLIVQEYLLCMTKDAAVGLRVVRLYVR